MINVNVFSNEKAWSKRLRKKEFFFNKICKSFPNKYKFSNKRISFTLLLSNNRNIKKLNKNFRKKNKSTDILSFPSQNKKDLKILSKSNLEIYLGDIIINSKKMNTSSKKLFKKHLDVLWIHGLIHLFGYDHKKDNNYKKMNAIENKLLNKLN